MRALWRLKYATLVTSHYAIEEARRNFGSGPPADRLTVLTVRMEVVADAPGFVPQEAAKLPEKDRPILAASVTAKCSYLLTGDAKHFSSQYGKWIAGVLVLRPTEYLREHGV
ncbi:MAG: hypothetical protein AMXMBFR7_43910 [Planctomycetota bacterium]